MAAADRFREQAEALYRLAKATPAAARLELVLEAMECEARAVAERGKMVSPATARTR